MCVMSEQIIIYLNYIFYYGVVGNIKQKILEKVCNSFNIT
jgi:hypothetical protein